MSGRGTSGRHKRRRERHHGAMSQRPATTIFAARRILTMNASRPEATHVAVPDGRILGIGPLDELRGFGPADIDERVA